MEENLGRGEVRDGLMEESSDISESLSQLSPKPLSLRCREVRRVLDSVVWG